VKLDQILLLCDIDGVLANFVAEFQLYMRLAYGHTLPLRYLTQFDLDKCIEEFLGEDCSPETAAFVARFSVEHVLQQLFNRPYFYWPIKPYMEMVAVLHMHPGPKVFVTSRDPALANATGMWMRTWGIQGTTWSGLSIAYLGEPYARGVDDKMGIVYTKNKGAFIAKTLQKNALTRLMFIEDKPRNVRDVQDACAEAEVTARLHNILLDQPYNRGADGQGPWQRMSHSQLLERMLIERRLFDDGRDTTF